MKTTSEISDSLLRRAEALAMTRRISLGELVSEALTEKVRVRSDNHKKAWMKTFGQLRHLHNETTRIKPAYPARIRLHRLIDPLLPSPD
ncbi:MAG TPA: hypothetical protein VK828_18145 [Terriglobales bacterium]|jgi:hypothetical protein|nr:hypothetical protein [Terriglobales bacterium]